MYIYTCVYISIHNFAPHFLVMHGENIVYKVECNLWIRVVGQSNMNYLFVSRKVSLYLL